ncbi:MAG: thiamine-phosphate synthase family protein [Halovenus sp.]
MLLARALADCEFDASYEARADALASLFDEHGVSQVIYHRGDHGIEPITYVFGETAVDAAETAAELIDRATDDTVC